MLLLHAADLHLGKTLHESDLHDEQKAMLDDLLAVAEARRPTALLLAGDLYDRAIPSPSALDLFDGFLDGLLEAVPGITVVAIPGNHDSAARLAFGAGLFRRAGVHFRLRLADADQPVMIRGGSEGRWESCAVWALPFLGAGSEEATSSEGGPSVPRGQAERFAAALGGIVPGLQPDSYNVLLAHCFAAGGRSSESERGFVGLAEEVDARLFDAFDYAALGHLHRPQAAGSKGAYSGAPLAYSFGEAGRVVVEAGGAARLAEAVPERGFLLVELGPGGAEREFLPHRPRRRMVRVEGAFVDLAAAGILEEWRDDFVEVRLTDADPVLDPADRLKRGFPHLLSVHQSAFEIRAASPGGGSSGGADLPGGDRGGGSDPRDPLRLIEDFRLFHREMRGEEPGAEDLALLSSLVEEAVHETD